MVTFRARKARWLILILFCILSFSNNLNWGAYSPVQSIAVKYWNVSDTAINWLSLIYLLVYIPGVFCANVMLDLFGLRNYVLAGSVLNLIGTLLRVFGSQPNAFWLLLVGQAICAAAQCFIFSAPNVIAAYWFPDTERSFAVGVGNAISPIGSAFGYLISPAIVSQWNYHDHFLLLAVIQFLLGVITVIPIFILFEAKPSTPPSAAAMVKTQSELTWRKAIKDHLEPWKYSGYWLLMHGLSVLQGAYSAMLTVIDEISEPRGYNTIDSGWFGFVSLVGGVPAVILTGILLDKTKWYLLCTRMTGIFAALSMLLLIAAYDILNKICIFIGWALIGSWCNSAIPIFLETAVEITFPVPESVSSAMILAISQIYGIVFATTFTNLAAYDATAKYTLWAFPAIVTLTAVMLLFVRGKLQRYELEEAVKQGTSNEQVHIVNKV